MEGKKKTLVFGGSLNPERYSHKAIKRLAREGHPVVSIGGRAGWVDHIVVLRGHPELKEVDTITMYMGEKRQEEHEEYLLSLSPNRIIFNPGAENRRLFAKAKKEGIEVYEACTLVMLSTGEF